MFVLLFGLIQFETFADGLLCRGDAGLLVVPETDFHEELGRIELPPAQFPSGTNEVDIVETNLPRNVAIELADLRAALEKSGKASNEVDQIVEAHRKERIKLSNFDEALEQSRYPTAAPETDDDGNLQPKISARPTFPQIDYAEGLPAEFADYLEGTIAWRNPAFVDKNFARIAWERILSRPPNERHFKSTWAAFMLGRSWEKENPEKAMKYFQKTRELATAGFFDNLHLAGESLGLEARLYLRQKQYERAIELYLQQLAEEDDFGEESSLAFTMRDLVSQESNSFSTLAENPLARRVVTAYLIATRALRISMANVAAPTRVTRDWLDATKAAGVDDDELTEELALLAYQNEDWETAQRWIDRAVPSPVTQWLQAQLLLRAGDTDKAEALLTKVAALIPLNRRHDEDSTQLVDNLSVRLPDHWSENSVAMQVQGELAVIHVARGDYVQALDRFLRAGFREDTAYVAERLLTVDELKSYVDRQWRPVGDDEDDDHDAAPPAWPGSAARREIRYLLARRLMRELRGNEARAYYPEEFQSNFDSLAESLTQGWNESLPANERAKALFDAAQKMRENGAELVGTSGDPDWTLYDGSQDGCDCMTARTNTDFTLLPATPDELRRAAAHHPDPDARFHYRYQAAFLGWEAAKLMPNNSEDTARVLCTAGSWLKYQDPDTADLFYKSLVRRNRKTEIGEAADSRRWFPDLDASGNLVKRTSDVTPTDVSNSTPSADTMEDENQGEGNEPTLERGEADGVAVYVVQSGDTIARIAILFGLTVEDLRQENALRSDRIMVGERLRIRGR